MSEKLKVAIGSDHAGFLLKESIKEYLTELGARPEDFGADSPDLSVDYPDYAQKVAGGVSSGQYDRGILVCATGIGMSITANRFPNVRAALVTSRFHAKMAAKHNKANVLVFGGKTTSPNQAKEMIKIWLESDFEGGRHERRIEKIENTKRK